MGLGVALSNFASDQAISKPQNILLLIVMLIFIMLYSQRLFDIRYKYYNVIVACMLIVVISIVILSTFVNILKIGKNREMMILNHVFNSPGSDNFFSVLLLVLYIIYIYELPYYDTDNPSAIVNKLTLGHNKYISNRLVGILFIFGFSISTGYMIYATTRESGKN